MQWPRFFQSRRSESSKKSEASAKAAVSVAVKTIDDCAASAEAAARHLDRHVAAASDALIASAKATAARASH